MHAKELNNIPTLLSVKLPDAIEAQIYAAEATVTNAMLESLQHTIQNQNNLISNNVTAMLKVFSNKYKPRIDESSKLTKINEVKTIEENVRKILKVVLNSSSLMNL